MAVIDADLCDLRVTVKSWITSLPYIDPLSGLTTQDMPIESAEIDDRMYEPRKHDRCTATVTFPSVQIRPELRGLLQQIIHGSRVEIYNFQPDCGNPVFSGYIPPEGITETDGKLTLTVHDPLVRGAWQSISRMEQDFSSPVNDLYTRGMQTYADLVNDDFSNVATFNSRWQTVGTPPSISAGSCALWGSPSTRTTDSMVAGGAAINLVVGDVILVEGDIAFYGVLPAQAQTPVAAPEVPVNWALMRIYIGMSNGLPFGAMQAGYSLTGDNTGITNTSGRYTEVISADRGLVNSTQPIPGDRCSLSAIAAVGSNTSRTQTLPVTMNVPFRMTCLIRILPSNRCVIYACRDNGKPQVVLSNQPLYSYHTGDENLCGVQPEIAQTDDLLLNWKPFFALETYYGFPGRVAVNNFRARRLTPYIARAPRFTPQTTDTKYYAASRETSADFLNHWVENDNAEYRVLYKIAPTQDQLELDQVNSLGTVAAPSYTYEEGVNLGNAPKRNARATPHANDVIRFGQGTQGNMAQAEAFSIAEVGNPLDPTKPAVYPYLEQRISDPSVDLASVAQTLAKYDLARALDPTPSITVEHVERVDTAFTVRAGDTVNLRTQSLITNLDQGMRVMRIKHRAGQPTREITVGRLENDPMSLRDLHKAILQEQLYSATGDGSQTTYIYPFCPWAFAQNTAAGQASPSTNAFADSYSANTNYVGAQLHWFMQSGTANQIVGFINGTLISTTSTSADSGPQDCTKAFQNPGQFDLHFVTTGATTSVYPILSSAFLVLRAKL